MMIIQRFSALMLAALLLACAVPAQATVLRLGHEHPTSSQFHLGALRFAQLVIAKTDGTLKVDVYAAGQIAEEAGLAAGIRNGTVDMALLAAGNVAEYNTDYLVFELPYLFRDYAHVDTVLNGPIGASMASTLEANGIKVVSYWESGFRNFTSNKPLHKPEDLAGLNIRSPQWPVLKATIELLGAKAVPMAFSDVYKACEDGRVDGQESPIFVVKAGRFNEVQKYMVLSRHIYEPLILGMNPRKFKNLSSAHQTALLEAAREAGVYERRLIRDQVESELKALKAGGMQIDETPDKDAWIRATAPVYNRLQDRFNPQLLKRIQDM